MMCRSWPWEPNQDTINTRDLILHVGTLPIITPPLANIHGLRRSKGTRLIVMRTFFSNLNIKQIVQNRHREIAQKIW
jgi:hypothetical protein